MTSNASSHFAKITAPTVADVLERPRLLALIDDAGAMPVLWVCGPAGCGKTTLVTSYLRSRKQRSIWYRVEPGDADPSLLFHYLRRACRASSPRSGEPLPPRFEPELGARLATFAPRFFRDLFARLDAPFVVVFDNYQEVAADSRFHEIIKDGLSELPAGGRAIIVSRTEPHPLFSRFSADRKIVRLDWSQLRFTEEETLALLERWSRPTVGRSTLRAVMEKTQGWVAGLVLLLAAPQPTGGVDLDDDLAPGAELFDYFATEVFNTLDPRRREFLMRTAFLPDMTADMAARLSGEPRANAVLAGLSRDGFFTDRHGMQPTSYVYHPLFRQFLLERARGDLPASDVAALERSAAETLAASGRVDDALRLACALRDWETVAALVHAHAAEMIRNGRHHSLGTWLAEVPEGVLDDEPWLRYWLGVSRFFGDPEGAVAALARSHEDFRVVGDCAGVFTSWSTIVRCLAEFSRYQEELDGWLDALDDLTRRYPSYPSKQVECQVASSMLAGLGYRRPWHPDLDAWGKRALALAEETGDVAAQFFVCIQRLHNLVFMPIMPLRSMLFERLRRLLATSRISVMNRMQYFFALAVHHCLLGNHRDCAEAADSALALAREYGIDWFVPTVLYTLGRSHLHAGNFEEASAIAARIGASAEIAGDTALAYRHGLLAAQYYLRDRLVEARQQGEAGLELLGAASTTWGNVVIGFVMIHVCSELGEPRAARERMNQLCAFAETSGNTQLMHHCCLAEAEIALNKGDVEGAVGPLLTGLQLARDLEVNWAYLWKPAALSRLFSLALERDLEVETVCRLIRLRNLHPGADAWSLENWPWPIRIRTLGDFAIIIDNERMAFRRKAQKKPLDLLKALIAFGGRGVGADRLKDALWPDADGDAAQRAFDTTLYRLRRLLGVKGALVLGEGRLSLSAHICWADVFALKQLVGKALSITGDPDPEPNEVAPLQKRIVSAYQGDFLDGLADDEWALSARHEIAARTIHALDCIGQYWERTGHWERAATCYRSGLEMDRLSSTMCAGLLRALSKLGDRNGALEIYRRFHAEYHERTGRSPPTGVEAARGGPA